MKRLCLLLMFTCAVVFSYCYKFDMGTVEKNLFITKVGGVANIIQKSQKLNSDEFGYKQLMGYFDGVIPANDITVGDVFLKLSLYDMALGIECYEVFLKHNNRTVMHVTLTIKDSFLEVNSAVFVYSDPH